MSERIRRRVEALEVERQPQAPGPDRIELVDPTTGRVGAVLHVKRQPPKGGAL